MSNSPQHISSDSPWEAIAGFSRAVRIGNTVAVSGTTASDEQGNTVSRGEPGTQTRYILGKIQRSLEAAGAQLSDVIRTRIYITNFGDWEEIARVHGEVFGTIRPANTMVVVRSLIPDDAVVEIEADAVIASA